MSHRMIFGTKPKNIDTHDLVKTGDPEIPDDDPFPAYCDRNGEVVLAFCRRCHGGESELYDESCIERLIKQAMAAEAKLTPLQRAINQLAQKRSWIIGESMMNDDGSPNGRTREECMAMVQRVAPEFVLLAEIERRNALEHVAEDGTTRKSHYRINERGEQPWDTSIRLGWAPEFAATNVLKYLRRDKDEPHSLQSAKVYYDWLNLLAAKQRNLGEGHAIDVLLKLDKELTDDERATVMP